MIKQLRKKIRKWLGITIIAETLQLQSNEIVNQTILIAEIIKIIKERTEYHIDVHNYEKRNSQIILIGKYRNRDYVNCYEIDDRTFYDLIQHCRKLEKYANKGFIDTTPEISACIEKKLYSL